MEVVLIKIRNDSIISSKLKFKLMLSENINPWRIIVFKEGIIKILLINLFFKRLYLFIKRECTSRGGAEGTRRLPTAWGLTRGSVSRP